MSEKRILVVDDEPEIVSVLIEALESVGFIVESAGTAAGALELIKEHIFDAAILDFNLPDMDGVMLHRRLREMDPELADRTLFMSGLVQSEENLGYYEAFGSGFLPKPFDIAKVLGALNELPPSES